MPLEEDNIPLLLTSNIDFRGINNTSNKLIAKEILDIKNVILVGDFNNNIKRDPFSTLKKPLKLPRNF